MKLTGIHHVTAVSADPGENWRFYTRDLGMRLVKKTVNQDDVSAYHLYYGDRIGSPGTALTFFDWNVPREQRGNNSVERTFLRVSGEQALEAWVARLNSLGIGNGGIISRDGRAAVEFEDNEGQRLGLVDDGGAGDEPVPWEASPVPGSEQIRGLGPVILSVPDPTPTDRVLTGLLGLERVREYDLDGAGTTVYQAGDGGAHAEVHLAHRPGLAGARGGAGGVHHVALRVPDQAAYDAWTERLAEARVPTSGPVDRYYFRSLYFREPNGILFELATDEPGFTVDEDASTLGEKLVLPPFLESRRAEIVAGLKPIEGA